MDEDSARNSVIGVEIPTKTGEKTGEKHQKELPLDENRGPLTVPQTKARQNGRARQRNTVTPRKHGDKIERRRKT